MKIKFLLINGDKQEITTEPLGFEVTQFGVKYMDPELNTPRVMTFDKIKAFSVEAKIDEEAQSVSSNIQKMKSDSSAKRNKGKNRST